MIDLEHREITISRQCELLELPRASYYYESNHDDSYNELIMNLIDEQFTSNDFTGILENGGIRISMDGKGRAYDNIFVERLWRSVKYEEVYLHQYLTVAEARKKLNQYFMFYNMERIHESLGYKTPYEIYFKELLKQQSKQVA